jgi:uncharacterized membrane protein (DUF373 family)
MTNSDTFARKVVRVILAALVIAACFFVFGFVLGYFFMAPVFPKSQFREGVDTGLFFLVVGFICDPVIFFTWNLFKKKKIDGGC